MKRHTKRVAHNLRSSPYGLVLLIVPTWFLLVGAPHFFAHGQDVAPEPLEVRLTKPPQWMNGCLSVSLDRINRSSFPLFLPDMGLYISTSVNELRDDAGMKDGQEWINVYGASDMVSWDATAIAPGATVHEEGCLPPTVFVVNLKKKTRREILLRGRLRIDAYYFLTEKEWQHNKSWHEEMLHISPGQEDKIAHQYPKVVTIFAAIPCREPACGPGCDDPPLILQGENRVLPDVFYLDPDWGARGKRISDELARKSPACSAARPAPR